MGELRRQGRASALLHERVTAAKLRQSWQLACYLLALLRHLPITQIFTTLPAGCERRPVRQLHQHAESHRAHQPALQDHRHDAGVEEVSASESV